MNPAITYVHTSGAALFGVQVENRNQAQRQIRRVGITHFSGHFC